MTDAVAFQAQLRETGAYETIPAHSRTLVDRLFGWCDLHFYAKVSRVILASGWDASHGSWDETNWARHSHGILRAVEGCGGLVTIRGLEHVKDVDGPFVCAANHMSMVEPLVLPSVLLTHGPLSVVLKENLLRYPALGNVIRAIDPICVGRRNAREDLKTVLAKGAESLANGRSILVFPQSTRSTRFIPRQFNTLGVKLAGRAGVPVIPLALKTDFVQPGKVIRDISRVNRQALLHFEFGAPLVVADQKEAHRRCVDFIRARLTEWGVNVSDEE